MNSLPQDEQETHLLVKDIMLYHDIIYHDTRGKPLKLPVSWFSVYGRETITSTSFFFFSERKVYKALRQLLSNAFGECLKETNILACVRVYQDTTYLNLKSGEHPEACMHKSERNLWVFFTKDSFCQAFTVIKLSELRSIKPPWLVCFSEESQVHRHSNGDADIRHCLDTCYCPSLSTSLIREDF